MKYWLLFLVFFLSLTLSFTDSDACLFCQYENSLNTTPDFFQILDEPNYKITTYFFYEKINETTGITQRVVLPNTVYIYKIIVKSKPSQNPEAPQVYFCRAHTNASGAGVLHLSNSPPHNLNDTNKTYTIIAIYHPLFEPIPSCPDSTSYIYNVTNGTNVSVNDLPICNGFTFDGTETIRNDMKHSANTIEWKPPSPKQVAVPAVCIPILIIGGMFLAFLFSSGRNPFLAFNFFSRVRASKTQNYYMRNKNNSGDLNALAQAASGVVSRGLTKAGVLKKKDGKVQDLLSLGKEKLGKAAGKGLAKLFGSKSSSKKDSGNKKPAFNGTINVGPKGLAVLLNLIALVAGAGDVIHFQGKSKSKPKKSKDKKQNPQKQIKSTQQAKPTKFKKLMHKLGSAANSFLDGMNVAFGVISSLNLALNQGPGAFLSTLGSLNKLVKDLKKFNGKKEVIATHVKNIKKLETARKRLELTKRLGNLKTRLTSETDETEKTKIKREILSVKSRLKLLDIESEKTEKSTELSRLQEQLENLKSKKEDTKEIEKKISTLKSEITNLNKTEKTLTDLLDIKSEKTEKSTELSRLQEQLENLKSKKKDTKEIEKKITKVKTRLNELNEKEETLKQDQSSESDEKLENILDTITVENEISKAKAELNEVETGKPSSDANIEEIISSTKTILNNEYEQLSTELTYLGYDKNILKENSKFSINKLNNLLKNENGDVILNTSNIILSLRTRLVEKYDQDHNTRYVDVLNEDGTLGSVFDRLKKRGRMNGFLHYDKNGKIVGVNIMNLLKLTGLSLSFFSKNSSVKHLGNTLFFADLGILFRETDEALNLLFRKSDEEASKKRFFYFRPDTGNSLEMYISGRRLSVSGGGSASASMFDAIIADIKTEKRLRKKSEFQEMKFNTLKDLSNKLDSTSSQDSDVSDDEKANQIAKFIEQNKNILSPSIISKYDDFKNNKISASEFINQVKEQTSKEITQMDLQIKKQKQDLLAFRKFGTDAYANNLNFVGRFIFSVFNALSVGDLNQIMDLNAFKGAVRDQINENMTKSFASRYLSEQQEKQKEQKTLKKFNESDKYAFLWRYIIGDYNKFKKVLKENIPETSDEELNKLLSAPKSKKDFFNKINRLRQNVEENEELKDKEQFKFLLKFDPKKYRDIKDFINNEIKQPNENKPISKDELTEKFNRLRESSEKTFGGEFFFLSEFGFIDQKDILNFKLPENKDDHFESITNIDNLINYLNSESKSETNSKTIVKNIINKQGLAPISHLFAKFNYALPPDTIKEITEQPETKDKKISKKDKIKKSKDVLKKLTTGLDTLKEVSTDERQRILKHLNYVALSALEKGTLSYGDYGLFLLEIGDKLDLDDIYEMTGNDFNLNQILKHTMPKIHDIIQKRKEKLYSNQNYDEFKNLVFNYSDLEKKNELRNIVHYEDSERKLNSVLGISTKALSYGFMGDYFAVQQQVRLAESLEQEFQKTKRSSKTKSRNFVDIITYDYTGNMEEYISTSKLSKAGEDYFSSLTFTNDDLFKLATSNEMFNNFGIIDDSINKYFIKTDDGKYKLNLNADIGNNQTLNSAIASSLMANNFEELPKPLNVLFTQIHPKIQNIKTNFKNFYVPSLSKKGKDYFSSLTFTNDGLTKYGFSNDDINKYFTKTNDGRYKLNLNADIGNNQTLNSAIANMLSTGNLNLTSTPLNNLLKQSRTRLIFNKFYNSEGKLSEAGKKYFSSLTFTINQLYDLGLSNKEIKKYFVKSNGFYKLNLNADLGNDTTMDSALAGALATAAIADGQKAGLGGAFASVLSGSGLSPIVAAIVAASMVNLMGKSDSKVFLTKSGVLLIENNRAYEYRDSQVYDLGYGELKGNRFFEDPKQTIINEGVVKYEYSLTPKTFSKLSKQELELLKQTNQVKIYVKEPDEQKSNGKTKQSKQYEFPISEIDDEKFVNEIKDGSKITITSFSPILIDDFKEAKKTKITLYDLQKDQNYKQAFDFVSNLQTMIKIYGISEKQLYKLILSIDDVEIRNMVLNSIKFENGKIDTTQTLYSFLNHDKKSNASLLFLSYLVLDQKYGNKTSRQQLLKMFKPVLTGNQPINPMHRNRYLSNLILEDLPNKDEMEDITLPFFFTMAGEDSLTTTGSSNYFASINISKEFTLQKVAIAMLEEKTYKTKKVIQYLKRNNLLNQTQLIGIANAFSETQDFSRDYEMQIVEKAKELSENIDKDNYMEYYFTESQLNNLEKLKSNAEEFKAHVRSYLAQNMRDYLAGKIQSTRKDQSKIDNTFSSLSSLEVKYKRYALADKPIERILRSYVKANGNLKTFNLDELIDNPNTNDPVISFFKENGLSDKEQIIDALIFIDQNDLDVNKDKQTITTFINFYKSNKYATEQLLYNSPEALKLIIEKGKYKASDLNTSQFLSNIVNLAKTYEIAINHSDSQFDSNLYNLIFEKALDTGKYTAATLLIQKASFDDSARLGLSDLSGSNIKDLLEFTSSDKIIIGDQTTSINSKLSLFFGVLSAKGSDTALELLKAENGEQLVAKINEIRGTGYEFNAHELATILSSGNQSFIDAFFESTGETEKQIIKGKEYLTYDKDKMYKNFTQNIQEFVANQNDLVQLVKRQVNAIATMYAKSTGYGFASNKRLLRKLYAYFGISGSDEKNKLKALQEKIDKADTSQLKAAESIIITNLKPNFNPSAIIKVDQTQALNDTSPSNRFIEFNEANKSNLSKQQIHALKQLQQNAPEFFKQYSQFKDSKVSIVYRFGSKAKGKQIEYAVKLKDKQGKESYVSLNINNAAWILAVLHGKKGGRWSEKERTQATQILFSGFKLNKEQDKVIVKQKEKPPFEEVFKAIANYTNKEQMQVAVDFFVDFYDSKEQVRDNYTTLYSDNGYVSQMATYLKEDNLNLLTYEYLSDTYSKLKNWDASKQVVYRDEIADYFKDKSTSVSRQDILNLPLPEYKKQILLTAYSNIGKEKVSIDELFNPDINKPEYVVKQVGETKTQGYSKEQAIETFRSYVKDYLSNHDDPIKAFKTMYSPGVGDPKFLKKLNQTQGKENRINLIVDYLSDRFDKSIFISDHAIQEGDVLPATGQRVRKDSNLNESEKYLSNLFIKAQNYKILSDKEVKVTPVSYVFKTQKQIPDKINTTLGPVLQKGKRILFSFKFEDKVINLDVNNAAWIVAVTKDAFKGKFGENEQKIAIDLLLSGLTTKVQKQEIKQEKGYFSYTENLALKQKGKEYDANFIPGYSQESNFKANKELDLQVLTLEEAMGDEKAGIDMKNYQKQYFAFFNKENDKQRFNSEFLADAIIHTPTSDKINVHDKAYENITSANKDDEEKEEKKISIPDKAYEHIAGVLAKEDISNYIDNLSYFAFSQNLLRDYSSSNRALAYAELRNIESKQYFDENKAQQVFNTNPDIFNNIVINKQNIKTLKKMKDLTAQNLEQVFTPQKAEQDAFEQLSLYVNNKTKKQEKLIASIVSDKEQIGYINKSRIEQYYGVEIDQDINNSAFVDMLKYIPDKIISNKDKHKEIQNYFNGGKQNRTQTLSQLFNSKLEDKYKPKILEKHINLLETIEIKQPSYEITKVVLNNLHKIDLNQNNINNISNIIFTNISSKNIDFALDKNNLSTKSVIKLLTLSILNNKKDMADWLITNSTKDAITSRDQIAQKKHMYTQALNLFANNPELINPQENRSLLIKAAAQYNPKALSKITTIITKDLSENKQVNKSNISTLLEVSKNQNILNNSQKAIIIESVYTKYNDENLQKQAVKSLLIASDSDNIIGQINLTDDEIVHLTNDLKDLKSKTNEKNNSENGKA